MATQRVRESVGDSKPARRREGARKTADSELTILRAPPSRLRGRVARALVPVVDVVALLVGTQALSDAGSAGLAYAAAVVATIALTGGYRFRISPRLGVDFWRLLGMLGIAALAFPLVLDRAALVDLAQALPGTAIAVLAGRAVSYGLLTLARGRGFLTEATLIVGCGDLAETIAETLQRHPEYGLRAVGFLDDIPDLTIPPVLGGIAELDRVLTDHAIQRVIVAFGSQREAELVPVLRACVRRKVDVYVTPRFFEMGVTQPGPEAEDVWGIPLVRLKSAAFSPAARWVKRTFDVVVAGAAVIVLSPVLLACAVAVRASIGSPVLFRQERVGLDGHPIRILKFRTIGASANPDTTWTPDGSAEIGRVGRFLRRTSLDELPQLVNVLSGQMSIVGPRPERRFFYDRFAASVRRYGDRQRVPVGITGWAQVHGLRGDTSIEERARFDNHYIEHWSLWLDLVICARTVRAMFSDHD